MPEPLLDIAITKALKSFQLVSTVRMSSEDGRVLVLFGPSGSGKTITLKCLAGVTDPDAGYITIAGRKVYDSNERLNVGLRYRRVGYLPQNYALFPHMNVGENIGFGLANWERDDARTRVSELVGLMQLEGLEKRLPRQLSGGQQQRVAFARALAPQPDILLLDEPFSALDALIRAELRQNLALLSRRLNLPVVFITHDLEEAYMLADRIAVLDRGAILQYGSRDEVFYRPANRQVARLIGLHNLLPGRVLEQDATKGLALIRTLKFDLWVALPPDPLIIGQEVTLVLRPELLNVTTTPTQINRYSVKIAAVVARGALTTLHLSVGDGSSPDIEVEMTTQQYAPLATAEILWLEINPSAVHMII